MRSSGVIGLLVVAALALAACGDSAPPQRPVHVVDKGHGLAYDLQPGWHRASVNLTPGLVDPREELSAGTFPLRYRRGACAQVPVSALEDMPPNGAFVTVQERGIGPGAGFPPRPKRFGPRLGPPAEFRECVPAAHFRDHWFTFADGGRHFHVDVAFGPRASKATQRQAWALLDGLHVDPSVKPTWRGSP